MCKLAVLVLRVIIIAVILLIFIFFNSLNETIFQETDAAASMKEIRRRDPYGHITIFLWFQFHLVLLSNHSSLTSGALLVG